jgi:hypothetical protein
MTKEKKDQRDVIIKRDSVRFMYGKIFNFMLLNGLLVAFGNSFLDIKEVFGLVYQIINRARFYSSNSVTVVAHK